MCLLVVLHRWHPDAPLIVAANRDEMVAREAIATTVLQQDGPRILGGRDLLAGGTWLAVNEHGVFAGLTNRPTLSRDPAKQSRGELPLALTAFANARDAVASFRARFRPIDYSPAWLLVGDATSLFLLDMTSGLEPAVTELPPGVHVLENRPSGAPSAKVNHVLDATRDLVKVRGDALRTALVELLRDHTIPDGEHGHSGVEGFIRPSETEANCVHAGPYATRSATLLVVTTGSLPRLWSSDGPLCTHPLLDRSPLWSQVAP